MRREREGMFNIVHCIRISVEFCHFHTKDIDKEWAMAGNNRAGAGEHEFCKRKGKAVDTYIKCAKMS